MAERKRLPESVKKLLLKESRNRCAICGSEAFLQLAHVKAFHEGGESTSNNLIVLCPTCHMAVDSSQVPSELLQKIKNDWVKNEKLGMEQIFKFSQKLQHTSRSESIPKTSHSLSNLLSWSEALKKSEEFDAYIRSVTEKINQVKNEDRFINEILKPLFDGMGYEGVTILHHNRLLEHGKDIVFYERESLGGGFTIYAVVACVGSIHSGSARANDSAHYQKILDQVHKCFEVPYSDHNLKADLYVDKVIVACSGRIGDGAMTLLRAWEDKNRRRLIFLDAEKIAGHKLRLHKK